MAMTATMRAGRRQELEKPKHAARPECPNDEMRGVGGDRKPHRFGRLGMPHQDRRHSRHRSHDNGRDPSGRGTDALGAEHGAHL